MNLQESIENQDDVVPDPMLQEPLLQEQSAESKWERLLQEKTTQLEQTYDKMLRIAADFENARKRWEKERQDTRTYAIQDFAKDLLPVIDALSKAEMALSKLEIDTETEQGQRITSILEGVQIVSKEFEQCTHKHGIERLPGKGSPFNPSYHNAISKVVDSHVEQETVLEEYTPGYKIGTRILRTALVSVVAPD